MRATVIEVAENLIYLQIGDQLRFKAPFETDHKPVFPRRTDTVDFDFQHAHMPVVIIHSVFQPSTRR